MQTTSADIPSFRLAPMSTLILWLTIGLWAIPVFFLGRAALARSPLLVPGIIVLAIYLWIWLRFRPTRFIVHPEALEVIWPLKRRVIPRSQIAQTRIVSNQDLRREIGWGMRVGAGGLWGGFGWLWTQRRGIVQMYVSRTDDFVWIERPGERSWLITPERPKAFVRAMGG